MEKEKCIKLSDDDIRRLQDRLDEIKAVVRAKESPFRSLSYLKSFINKLMHKINEY